MAKAVFVTKINPVYDDLPEVRYHFPATYLRRVEQTLGDWIIYYEPRRRGEDPNDAGGRKVYFSTARVTGIISDPSKADHYYAQIDTSTYLEFDYAVPFKDGDHYYESALTRPDGATNKGAFGHAVRIIPEHEYELILQVGFAPILQAEALQRKVSVRESKILEFADNGQEEFKRPIIERVVKRPFRDAAFSKLVKDAYQQTCAMTGLKIVNGGGRTEAQAAHIMPVEKDGPDSIRNGIALCSTIHWMFDRGLVSIDENYTILKADGKIPEPAMRLLNPDGKLILPSDIIYRPHDRYMKFHRENIFKG